LGRWGQVKARHPGCQGVALRRKDNICHRSILRKDRRIHHPRIRRRIVDVQLRFFGMI
jgi:hypothetical protein